MQKNNLCVESDKALLTVTPSSSLPCCGYVVALAADDSDRQSRRQRLLMLLGLNWLFLPTWSTCQQQGDSEVYQCVQCVVPQ
jgi:hypothetical protein